VKVRIGYDVKVDLTVTMATTMPCHRLPDISPALCTFVVDRVLDKVVGTKRTKRAALIVLGNEPNIDTGQRSAYSVAH